MRISKKSLVLGLSGLIIGAVLTTLVRFVAYKPDTVHYHANVALYINGTREMFAGPGYYEEVQSCTSKEVDNPKTRVHLHDQNPGLVHVHAHGVMWADLFANLGYGLSDKVVTTNAATYVDGLDDNRLTFILNGKPVTSIAGKLVTSEDKLLINYGNDDETAIQKHVVAIPSDARKANAENDPSTCSGTKPPTFTERLKIALGFNPKTSH